MILCVTGFGWSGSGAVYDLLHEYSDITVCDNHGSDFELYLLHDVDGIYDLEQNVMVKHNRVNSYIAIQRFERLIEGYCDYLHYEDVFKGHFKKLSSEYIEKITDYKFSGSTFYEYLNTPRIWHIYNRVISKIFSNRLLRMVFKKTPRGLFYNKTSDIRVSYRPTDFAEITHEYVNNLLNILKDRETKVLAIDQIFPPDCPELFMKYVDNPKCIIVRRDPRDTYLLAKCTYKSKVPIPTDSVDDFISFYKKTVVETKTTNNPQILNINFEDLIYNYIETQSLIEAFVGIKEHDSPKSFFDPQKSINNTQLFKLYKGYEKDIELIESELRDSLFDFDKYLSFSRNSNAVF